MKPFVLPFVNNGVLLMLLLFFQTSSQVSQFIPQYKSGQKAEEVFVSINGAGIISGTYLVSPSLRVLDVIKIANNGKLPDMSVVDYRRITIIENSEDPKSGSLTIDLFRYLCGKDMSQNPFVVPGEYIQLNYATQTIVVQGDILGPVTGSVPFKQGETIETFLNLYAFSSSSDTASISYQLPSGESIIGPLSRIGNYSLQNQAILSVHSKKETNATVRVMVKGEVVRPGLYVMPSEKSSLKQLIHFAGNYTTKADTESVYIVRKYLINNKIKKTINEMPALMNDRVRGAVSFAVASNDYAILPVEHDEIVLHDSDEVIIPSFESSVYISGCVKKPGPYPFSHHFTITNYIHAAGGYALNADKSSVGVFRIYENAYVIVDSDMIRPGSIIVVAPKDKDKLLNNTLDIVRTVVTAISASVTFLVLINNSK